MVDIAWAPMLGAFSVNFEEFEDEDVVELCLAGFRVRGAHCVCIIQRVFGCRHCTCVHLMMDIRYNITLLSPCVTHCTTTLPTPQAAIRLHCLLDMTMLRNTYLSSLGRFTMLHSPASMRTKHARAFKTLLVVAEENGNHMQECWEEVLRCISRVELLQQLVAGLPSDALLFGSEGRETPKKQEGFSLGGAFSLGGKGFFSQKKAAPSTCEHGRDISYV